MHNLHSWLEKKEPQFSSRKNTLPVNILIYFSGHVKIDDGCHLRDVETAGRHSRGHEQRPLPGLEVVEHLLPFTLQSVTYKQKSRLPAGTYQRRKFLLLQ